MSAFLDRFRGEQTDWKSGRPIWTTLAPLRYRSAHLGKTIIIPAEMVTDLASVPRLPLLWLAAGGRGIRSATVHDFAYMFGFWWIARRDRWYKGTCTRAMADRVFYESLLADPISGTGRIRAWQMYQAVRLGGRGVCGNEDRKIAMNPIWSSGAWETPESP